MKLKRNTLLLGWSLILGGLSACTSPDAGPMLGSAGRPPVTGTWSTVLGLNGQALRAYAAGPANACAGVLVVHDYFGITDFTRSAVERLAAQGYRALAIDLYGGKAATHGEEATALMQAYAAQDRHVSDAALQAGMDALKRPGRRLATLGFSMGGAEAFKAALNDPDAVQATVVVYGFGLDTLPPAQLARMKGRVLSLTGALDEGSLKSSLDYLRNTATTQAPALELHVLPRMKHAFAQPLFDSGKGYSPSETRVAWNVVDGFLAREVSPSCP